jgi:aminoglycoside phosphotransferase family enzyme/predicted kinase
MMGRVKEVDPYRLASLREPRAYPHPATEVQHLETHISHVLLAGDYAYKLKKPVDLGFLDFTTLEKRLAACQEELRLNRRLAPEVYLGVSTVCAADGRLRLRDDGCEAGEQAVDYAVRMVRLPQDGMLDFLATHGRLARPHVLDAARQMARFHAAAERGPAVARYGEPEAIAAPIRQNFAQTERYIGVTIPRARFERLGDWSERFLRERAALFAARVRAGRIVDGHGDLHLRNMCLYRDRVVIFDCIEFNPALRAGDAIGDIAFLTMDLDYRGLAALGNAFLNEYLERTQDYAGLALLDFYQVYHAYVRGKVNSFLLDGAGSEADKLRAREEAGRYFELAERYLAPRAPGLLVTSGLSASGKSTLAARVAERLGGIRVRSDAVRKHLAGMQPEARDRSGYNQGIYAPAMSARVYEQLREHARAVVAAGRWAILDATYSRRAHRDEAAALARSLALPFGILHCHAPTEELKRRIVARAAAGTDVSDAGLAVLEEQVKRFEPPAPDEAPVFRWTGTEDPGEWLASLGAVLPPATEIVMNPLEK